VLLEQKERTTVNSLGTQLYVTTWPFNFTQRVKSWLKIPVNVHTLFLPWQPFA